MVFSSITFLLYFLPFFLICYALVPKSEKNLVLLLFSLIFYAWGAPRFIFLLVASTIIDFYLVNWMHKHPNLKKKKWILASSIFLNVGLLIYFKYANFFVENVNEIRLYFGSEAITWKEVLLPIGISFYTFQTLTYSIDVYRGLHPPLKNVQTYLVYILSFPQMIAGPIVRFNEVVNELLDRNPTYSDRIHGLFRFSLGLFKKVMIANVLGFQADEIMDLDPKTLHSVTAWIGILAYTFQIYFDFSAYSDMAIGLGKIMGFRFPENFNKPYISASITEFWRRWHITLGAWMKDYLYIPLGGNRVNNKARLYANLITVFLISGLWHGASWNYVLWGAIHGVFLMLDRMFLNRILHKTGKWIAVPFTFLVVVLAWVYFRIENIEQAHQYVEQLFAFQTNIEFQMPSSKFISIAIFALLLSFLALMPQLKTIEKQIYFPSAFTNSSLITFTCLSVFFIVISVANISSVDFNPFIYFRF
ncbi:MAG: MBOAT family O-acyltransferase [Flavobacteriales bacterium]